ncbi:MAG TPA: ABC transporter substrate-binding protein [Chloroflexota bacterium]|nr:ABC transporter substrate-binding protein [Chloroflexota bacterium]
MATLTLAACGGGAAAPSSPAPVSKPAAPASAAAASASAKPAGSSATSASAKPAASGAAAKPSASAAASLAPFQAFNPNAPGDKMVVSHSQLNSTPNEAALASGIFAKNNLNVDVRYIPQGATGMQVLLSGETNVAELGGAEMVAAAANGADVVILANLEPVYPFKFMVSKDIQNAQDLKGKKVGITTVGSVDDTSIRAALPTVGIDPTKDVNLVPVGPEPARVAALLNGQIQATDATPSAWIQIEAGGGHMLFDIAALKLPAATAALAAQRSWVNSHKDITQRYIDSIVEAIAWERNNKAAEEDVMRKVFKFEDPKVLDAVYDYYVLQTMAPVPLPQMKEFQATVDEVAKQNPKVKGLDLSKVLDPSFVQSAVDRGLNK